ncbi:putative B3 domain-containing protein Os03g0621600 [Cornus florida]|uniref:putative B3 domain-containing protein Os03g0621600 n=1 Tax=Cornus florida TaxID=4283 RepID=UPI00289A9111|nr:putative B3 domain-containing protein Os03g0621600 [Cornus florida]
MVGTRKRIGSVMKAKTGPRPRKVTPAIPLRRSIKKEELENKELIPMGVASEYTLRKRIPKKFITSHGNNLSNPVFLKVPTGAVWTIELVHSDGDVWLQNGWKEFKEYYSIDYGHMLVFKYDGNSHFHVHIFDTSASEIEYPSDAYVEQTNNNMGCQMPNTDAIEVGDSVEILNHFPTYQTREEINGVKSDECSGSMATISRNLHNKSPERRPKVSADEKKRALGKAKAYKSKDPFFVVVMQPSYVEGRCNLNIPVAFARKYLSHNQRIILGDSNGTTWSAECCFVSGWAKLSSGWKSFASDNHLQVGDVCVFQLTEGIQTTLKVIIFPAKKFSFSDKSPQFFKVYIPEQSSQRLRIPPAFLKHFDGVLPSKSIIRSHASRSWRVEVRKVDNNLYFEKGWHEFVEDNSLEFGDFLVFCYGGDSIFFVKVFGKNGCHKELQKINRTSHRRGFMAVQENDKSLKPPGKSLSSYPSFQVVMQKAYVDKSFLIPSIRNQNTYMQHLPIVIWCTNKHASKLITHIPLSFVMSYIKKGRQDAILRVSAKSWDVKLIRLMNGVYRIGRGWRAFCKDNTLQVGDVCVFELIERDDFVLKVSVSRSSN